MSRYKNMSKSHISRLCSFLIALICIVYSCASADEHFTVELSFPEMSENRIETLDLYVQDGKSIAVSSLLSDYAIEKDSNENHINHMDLIAAYLMFPNINSELYKNVAEIMKTWISQQSCATISGHFSGNMFENASSLRSCEFPVSGFVRYLHEIIRLTDQDDLKNHIAQMLISYSDELFTGNGLSDPIIRTDIYDEGQYCTLMLIQDCDVLASFSADFSAEGERKVLISYKQNSRYCFINYHLLCDDQNSVLSVSFNTSQTSFYPIAESPMIRSVFSSTLESASNSSFLWSVEFQNIKEPITIKGNLSKDSDGHTELIASVFFVQSGIKAMDIIAYTETMNRKVSFTDKRILKISKQTDNAEIQLSACSGAMLLTAAIIPLLPAEYQNMLIKLLLQ